jgi:glycosyltransferase involved in cell wall biosynthesis
LSSLLPGACPIPPHDRDSGLPASRSRPTVVFVAAVGMTLAQFVRPLSIAARADGWRTVAIAQGATSSTGFDATYDLPDFRRRGPFALRIAYSELSRILAIEKPDLVHLHSPIAVALGRIAARRRGVHSVAVIHGTFLSPFTAWTLPYAAAEIALARLSSATVTLNEEDCYFYQRLARARRVVKAPVGGMGIDMRRLRAASSVSSRKSYRGSPCLLYLGRLTRDKNLDLLLQAWLTARQTLPNLRLRLVGSALPGDKSWTPPLMPGLELFPWSADPAMAIIEGDVLISPSPREGFSMAVAEAISLGIPVIAVTNRGTRSIARQGLGDLLLVSSDQAALALGIVSVIHRLGDTPPPPLLPECWSTSTAVAFHLRVLAHALCDNGRTR